MSSELVNAALKLAAIAVEYETDHPTASEADVAKAIVEDVDRFSVTVFELAA